MMTAGDDWGADWGDAFNHLVTGCEWFLTWKMCVFFLMVLEKRLAWFLIWLLEGHFCDNSGLIQRGWVFFIACHVFQDTAGYNEPLLRNSWE